jgi:CubicO group peptidase (beta-lactamase class C family)
MKRLVMVCLLFATQIQAQNQTNKKFLTSTHLSTLMTKAKEMNYSGTMLMYQGEEKLLAWSNGMAQNESGVANSTEVRYNIGSIGKSLTAVLIMQLLEQQKLELDKPVRQYLPKEVFSVGSPAITVRHLLNNTSGLGDFFESPDFSEEKTITIDDHLKLINQMKPVSDTPGTQLHYSNSGFIVLGKLLEQAYGKPFQQIVQERLLKTAGIRYQQKVVQVTGYFMDSTGLKKGEGNDPARWTSAGGIFLSANELHLLIHGIVTGKFIRKETLQRLWQKESRPEHEPPFVHYGLGWMLEDPNCIRLRGHNGGVKGFQSAFRYLPDDDLYIYFLSNRDGGIEAMFMNSIFMLMEAKGCKMEMPGQ